MRRVIRGVGLFGLLCMVTLDLSASSARRFALMETGDFFGFLSDDGAEIAPPLSGELWLGLFPTGQGFELRPARLMVSVSHEDLGVGSDRTRLTTTHIAVRGRQSPIFLLKTGGQLAPGPVPAAFAGELPLHPGKFVRLLLGGREYLLELQTAASTTSEQGIRGSLILDSQSFFEGWVPRDHATWSLLWAGDLDRDGKLDFYLELGGGIGGERRLFLSSAAKKGEPVGLAAYFLTLGC
jgi:hypothetical protein